MTCALPPHKGHRQGLYKISRALLFCLSWARLVNETKTRGCMAFILLSAALLHVALGLPLFLFPSGVHWSIILVIVWGFLRKTCPGHLHHRLVMTLCPGQVFVGDLLWPEYPENPAKTWSEDTTQLWYNFSFELVPSYTHLQALFMLWIQFWPFQTCYGCPPPYRSGLMMVPR